VITHEGIDNIAQVLGKEKEIVELTNKAMGGSMPFSVALANRLNIL